MKNVLKRKNFLQLEGGKMSEKNKNPSSKKGKDIPMSLRLRVAYGFANAEEQILFSRLNLESKPRNEKENVSGCEPTGCESSANTGGCSPGTSCLFTCLQTHQE